MPARRRRLERWALWAQLPFAIAAVVAGTYNTDWTARAPVICAVIAILSANTAMYARSGKEFCLAGDQLRIRALFEWRTIAVRDIRVLRRPLLDRGPIRIRTDAGTVALIPSSLPDRAGLIDALKERNTAIRIETSR